MYTTHYLMASNKFFLRLWSSICWYFWKIHLKRSWTTIVKNYALHLRLDVFLAVDSMRQLGWNNDWRLLKVSLNNSTLLSDCVCSEIWNVPTVKSKTLELHLRETAIRFTSNLRFVRCCQKHCLIRWSSLENWSRRLVQRQHWSSRWCSKFELDHDAHDCGDGSNNCLGWKFSRKECIRSSDLY